MLEIISLLYLSKKIGKIAVSKGQKKRPNIVFLVAMWLAGQLIGALLGLLLFKGRIVSTYVLSLVGAALASVIAFNVVQNLEDKNDDGVITIEID